jgi:hypothetical protein
LRPKTSRLLFGQLVWRKIYIFLLDEWTTYFTSFPWTPSTPNSDSVWTRGKFLLKTSIKLIFHVFSKELLHAAMWLKLPKGWRVGFLKNTPSVPNYLNVLIGTQILRNLWRICENTKLGSNPSLNKLSNELFYTQNGVVNKKIWWFDHAVVEFSWIVFKFLHQDVL